MLRFTCLGIAAEGNRGITSQYFSEFFLLAGENILVDMKPLKILKIPREFLRSSSLDISR